jgi:four helix bundle protein
MKRKTPNAQRRTPNAEVESKRTPNTQRPALNIEWGLHGLRVNESPMSEYSGRRDRRYDLEDRFLDFAVDVVELTESLPNTRAGNHIAGQLLRCGTSPLSNHDEVEAAESRKDFLHKLRVCLKELRETKRWLRLVSRLKRLGEPAILPVCLNEIEELIRIFAASVRRQKGARNHELFF